jgi:hypothetical protein
VVVKVDQTKTVHKANKVRARNLKGLTLEINPDNLDKTSQVRVTKVTSRVSQINRVEEEIKVLNREDQMKAVQVLTETGSKKFPALKILNQTWIRT